MCSKNSGIRPLGNYPENTTPHVENLYTQGMYPSCQQTANTQRARHQGRLSCGHPVVTTRVAQPAPRVLQGPCVHVGKQRVIQYNEQNDRRCDLTVSCDDSHIGANSIGTRLGDVVGPRETFPPRLPVTDFLTRLPVPVLGCLPSHRVAPAGRGHHSHPGPDSSPLL